MIRSFALMLLLTLAVLAGVGASHGAHADTGPHAAAQSVADPSLEATHVHAGHAGHTGHAAHGAGEVGQDGAGGPGPDCGGCLSMCGVAVPLSPMLPMQAAPGQLMPTSPTRPDLSAGPVRADRPPTLLS